MEDKILKNINTGKIADIAEKSDRKNALEFLVSYYSSAAESEQDSMEYFLKLKQIYLELYNDFDKNMKTRLNAALSNICLRKITAGVISYHYEFEELYLKIISDGTFSNTDRNNYFDKRLFKAIIVTSLYLKKVGWLENFLNDYINYTDPQFKDHLLNYARAGIQFEKRNYDKALFYLNNIDQKQIIYKIDCKNLTAKIYYETNSRNNLFPLLDTYKKLLVNNEIKNDVTGKAHLAFINFLKKIALAEKTDAEQLINSVNKSKILNSKPWLLEKLNELK